MIQNKCTDPWHGRNQAANTSGRGGLLPDGAVTCRGSVKSAELRGSADQVLQRQLVQLYEAEVPLSGLLHVELLIGGFVSQKIAD